MTGPGALGEKDRAGVFPARHGRVPAAGGTLKLLDVAGLVEQCASLDEGLTELAAQTARHLGAQRCSIMLLCEADEGPSSLRVFSHFGDLPAAAYNESIAGNQSISGHVLQSREPLVINDIDHSSLAARARHPGRGGRSLISVPILLGEELLGVLNLSGMHEGRVLDESDLELVSVFARFIGKSIQTFQLQKLLRSRLMQMAIVADERDRGDSRQSPISPDPHKLACLVSKNLYRELRESGFGPNGVIAIASELINLLGQDMGHVSSRPESDASAKSGDD